jgi:hypothetical protein
MALVNNGPIIGFWLAPARQRAPRCFSILHRGIMRRAGRSPAPTHPAGRNHVYPYELFFANSSYHEPYRPAFFLRTNPIHIDWRDLDACRSNALLCALGCVVPPKKQESMPKLYSKLQLPNNLHCFRLHLLKWLKFLIQLNPQLK